VARDGQKWRLLHEWAVSAGLATTGESNMSLAAASGSKAPKPKKGMKGRRPKYGKEALFLFKLIQRKDKRNQGIAF
jgi:hypothetical protein